MLRSLFTAAAICLLATGVHASDDLVADGKKVYKKCAACHAIGEGAKKKVGPDLNGIIGRVAGSVEDFKYSQVLVALGEAEFAWDEETLTGYLAKPKDWLKEFPPTLGLDCGDLKKCKGKMAFAGLKKEKDLTAILAYLATFDEMGMAVEPATN